MKYLIYVLLVIATAILVFNLFHVNYSHVFAKDSVGAVIAILCSLCVIVMMFILMTSRKIRKKAEQQNHH